MFREITEEAIPYFVFSELENIPGFYHAFSSRATDSALIDAGDPCEVALSKPGFLNQLSFDSPPALLSQIHSSTVIELDELWPEDHRPPGDGFLVTSFQRPAVIRTADCLSVLVIAPAQQLFVTLHAGWRGTCDYIVRRGVRRLLEVSGARPQDLVAALGPCIRVCCYEVGAEVLKKYREAGHPLEQITRGRHLDLIEANRAQLRELEVDNILDSGCCTSCSHDRFYSYRRGQDQGRMWTVAGFRKGAGPPARSHFNGAGTK